MRHEFVLLDSQDRMTHAGAWLLARDVRMLTTCAYVSCALFMGTEKVRILDRRDFYRDIPTTIDDTVAWILTKINVEFVIEHVQREERPELPEEALREAVANAVAHRGYRSTGNVHVYVFKDRVEVLSPGRLPEGMTEADLGRKSMPRNPLLFGMLYRMGVVENVGSGIRCTRELCREHGVAEPVIKVSEHWVTVTFQGDLQQAQLHRSGGELHPLRRLDGRNAEDPGPQPPVPRGQPRRRGGAGARGARTAARRLLAHPGCGQELLDGDVHPQGAPQARRELHLPGADGPQRSRPPDLLVRDFLDEREAPLDDVNGKTGFARNAAIEECKDAANENDENRKRFEVICRAVFKKFRACINVPGVNAFRTSRDAVDIVYRSLQRDREQADISDIIRALHRVVDEAIETRPDGFPTGETRPLYDISRIDFDRLRQEFDSSMQRRTVVQNLRHVVEQRLKRLLAQNPLRTDFQRHYEGIVADYNREKDRVTIERTFEELLKFAQELDEESRRAVREGLDEESLAIFDLLKKDALSPGEIRSIKQVACNLLETLKAEKLRIDEWQGKESTRDAVFVAIHDFLYSSETGLPESSYNDDDVRMKAEDVFRHVYRAYPVVPSPYYEHAAAA